MVLENRIKTVLQTDIYNFIKYPYYDGQKFLTDENIYYEDVGGYRCAVVPSKLISSTISLVTDTDLANNFAILNNAGTYSIYYYDKDGVPRLISGGSGTGVHNDLSGRSEADAHPISAITGLQTTLDDKISSSTTSSQTISGPLQVGTGGVLWEIDTSDGNLRIQQGSSSTILTIYSTTIGSGTIPYKIKIEGKTEITDLDFGGW